MPDKSKVPARPGSKARTGFSGRLVQPGSGPDPSDGQISFLDVWGKEKGTRAPSICRPPWRILSLIREKFSHHFSLSRTPSIFSPYCSCSRACLFKSAVASQLSPVLPLALARLCFPPPPKRVCSAPRSFVSGAPVVDPQPACILPIFARPFSAFVPAACNLQLAPNKLSSSQACPRSSSRAPHLATPAHASSNTTEISHPYG